MRIAAAVGGLVIIAVILWDSFETIILPRRVTRPVRLTRVFYRSTWAPWAALALRMKPGKRREDFLSFYGPLSLLFLFGVWAAGLIVAFSWIYWSLGSAVRDPTGSTGYVDDLYMSGTTFLSLGLGDVTPSTWMARTTAVLEAGLGFGFLAVIITYLPVLYGAFSHREVNISLMDARAGSPPSAGELLRRNTGEGRIDLLLQYLRDLEPWSAQLMESHLSYPVLCFFRSQHSNQSWLASLTTILDGCAFLAAYSEGELRAQARRTFAISRHAIVDLAQALHSPPKAPARDRLAPCDRQQLQAILVEAGIAPADIVACGEKLDHLRQMYEPYVNAVAERLIFPLPGWTGSAKSIDNWQSSPWGRKPGDRAGELEHL